MALKNAALQEHFVRGAALWALRLKTRTKDYSIVDFGFRIAEFKLVGEIGNWGRATVSN